MIRTVVLVVFLAAGCGAPPSDEERLALLFHGPECEDERGEYAIERCSARVCEEVLDDDYRPGPRAFDGIDPIDRLASICTRDPRDAYPASPFWGCVPLACRALARYAPARAHSLLYGDHYDPYVQDVVVDTWLEDHGLAWTIERVAATQTGWFMARRAWEIPSGGTKSQWDAHRSEARAVLEALREAVLGREDARMGDSTAPFIAFAKLVSDEPLRVIASLMLPDRYRSGDRFAGAELEAACTDALAVGRMAPGLEALPSLMGGPPRLAKWRRQTMPSCALLASWFDQACELDEDAF